MGAVSHLILALTKPRKLAWPSSTVLWAVGSALAISAACYLAAMLTGGLNSTT
jgi:hypothetical protein